MKGLKCIMFQTNLFFYIFLKRGVNNKMDVRRGEAIEAIDGRQLMGLRQLMGVYGGCTSNLCRNPPGHMM